jgi:PiT family inorganic phosphate transporter
MDAMNLNVLWVAGPGLMLAWANGANDVCKGVATLLGSGAASERHALLWGALWTVLGGVAAVFWGAALVSTFSKGFLTSGFPVSTVFIVSALGGAVSWVLLATWLGWPVSTTHALLGGIVGAALIIAGPEGLSGAAVANKALLPLFLSTLAAILLCWCLLWLGRLVAKRVPAWRPGCCEHEAWLRNPFVCDDRERQSTLTSQRIWTALHWFSAGATSFARGLNDVPKIAAFLLLALASGMSSEVSSQNAALVIMAVAVVMGMGGMWGGRRVLGVLAHRVTTLDPGRSLAANLGTSMLVLAASPLGLPVSTTHVSTGSLIGIRWADKARPAEGDALRSILFAWVITLPVAGGVAALTAVLIGLL